MFLVGAYIEYPTETRSDLQRFFGLNIEHMGRDFSIWQAAACLRHLPLESALLTSYTQSQATDSSGLGKFDAVPVDELKAWRENTCWEEVEGKCRTLK